MTQVEDLVKPVALSKQLGIPPQRIYHLIRGGHVKSWTREGVRGELVSRAEVERVLALAPRRAVIKTEEGYEVRDRTEKAAAAEGSKKLPPGFLVFFNQERFVEGVSGERPSLVGLWKVKQTLAFGENAEGQQRFWGTDTIEQWLARGLLAFPNPSRVVELVVRQLLLVGAVEEARALHSVLAERDLDAPVRGWLERFGLRGFLEESTGQEDFYKLLSWAEAIQKENIREEA